MISVFCNASKNKRLLLRQVEGLARELGEEFYVADDFPPTKEDLAALSQSKVAISLGGDGTILALFAALVQARATHVPILPVHFGTLGFISSVGKGEVARLLRSTLNNHNKPPKQHKLDRRSFLAVRFGQQKTFHALNEVYISRGDMGKPIDLTTWIDGVKTTTMRSDGIILATPTGSTAYSLSAGGPLIAPGLKVVLYTPVCAHSLTAKPLVIDGGKTIDIETTFKSKAHHAQLIVDGVFRAALSYGESLRCRLSSKAITFIKPAEENPYEVLKNKLGWLKY